MGKKIALLGFGVENISVAKFLLKHKIDFEILDKAPVEELTDDGQELIKAQNLKIRTGDDYLSNLADYNFIIRSPGIPCLTPEIQAARLPKPGTGGQAKLSGSEITSSTKLFLDWCPAKIIGITGTKGKGTTASLIFSILKKAQSSPVSPGRSQGGKLKVQSYGNVYLIGNIGIASFDIIEEVKPNDLVVFELSSFQIQDLSRSPHITVVTNLTDDHLDYHQTLEEYRATKQTVLKYQNENDYAILNQDYPECYKLKEYGKAKKYFFSSHEKTNGAYVNLSGDVILTINGEKKICGQNEIKLIGRHNLENIAAATIVGEILEVPINDIHQAVINFGGLEHRLEFVREVSDVKFYNDSFSTNPTPTIAAIRSFSEPITIILGGSKKGAQFHKLAKEIQKSTVNNIILIGVESPRIRKSLEEANIDAKIIEGERDIKLIIDQALNLATKGSIVLFSPACASFDMFKNYKDRGEKFKAEVAKL